MNLETYAAIGEHFSICGSGRTLGLVPYLIGHRPHNEVVAVGTRDGEPVLLDSRRLDEVDTSDKAEACAGEWTHAGYDRLGIVTYASDPSLMVATANRFWEPTALTGYGAPYDCELASDGSRFVDMSEFTGDPDQAHDPELEDAWQTPAELNPALARLVALDFHARVLRCQRVGESPTFSADLAPADDGGATESENHADDRSRHLAASSPSAAAAVFADHPEALAAALDRIWLMPGAAGIWPDSWYAAFQEASDDRARAVAALLGAFATWRRGQDQQAQTALASAREADPHSSYVQTMTRLLSTNVAASDLPLLSWPGQDRPWRGPTWPMLNAGLHREVMDLVRPVGRRLADGGRSRQRYAVLGQRGGLNLVDLTPLTGGFGADDDAFAQELKGRCPGLFEPGFFHALVEIHVPVVDNADISVELVDGSAQRHQVWPDFNSEFSSCFPPYAPPRTDSALRPLLDQLIEPEG